MNSIQVLSRKLSTITPYANNAKIHSKAQIKSIAASIKEFGFNNPILLDSKGGIIAGHGRFEAAKLLKMKDAPCITLGHLSEDQKKAYILADNRLGEIGVSWDMNLVNIELESLQMQDFNIDVTGFDFSFDRDVADSLGVDNFAAASSGEHEDDDLDANEDYEEYAPDTDLPVKPDKGVKYPIYIMADKQLFMQYKQMRGELADDEFLMMLLDK